MLVVLVIGIIVFMALVFVSWWINTYNFYRSIMEAIDSQWSNIVTEYERRVDLFLNLAKNVKSFKNHEQETFKEIASLRSAGLRNSPKNLKKMNHLLSGLNISVEAYPELKANSLYERFMDSIKETENVIQTARTGFNTLVREYETSRVTFPSNFIAGFHRFHEIKYYDPKRKDVNGTAPRVDV